MSDYIFNCFKEHVTTGLVCSLSAATDVLTEQDGHRRAVSSGEHTLTYWHMNTFTGRNKG